MELLQLKYFEKVATLENMTRAAKELHISQPALSNSIMRLEQELGVKFFDRTSRSIKLNKQGVYMLSKVKKILTMVDSITADSYSTVSGGTISIALDTHSSHLLDCIRDFRTINPQISFRLFTEIRVWESTAVSEFDFLLHTSKLKLPYAIQNIALGTQSYHAVLPKEHPLAECESIPIMDLKDESFCFVQVGSMTLEAAYGLCIESGFAPKIATLASNMYEKVACIQKNIGIGIVAVGNLDIVSSIHNLVTRPIREFSNLTDIKFSWKTQPPLSPSRSNTKGRIRNTRNIVNLFGKFILFMARPPCDPPSRRSDHTR